MVEPWEGAVEGWAVRFCRENEWRVRPYLDLDDLVQEAFLVYLECCKRYSDVETGAHFQSLFMVSVRNMVCTAANRRRRPDPTRVRSDCVDGEQGTVDDEDSVSNAPAPVRRLLRALSGRHKPYRRSEDRRSRETTREYVARVAEAPGQDVLGMVLAWAQQES